MTCFAEDTQQLARRGTTKDLREACATSLLRTWTEIAPRRAANAALLRGVAARRLPPWPYVQHPEHERRAVHRGRRDGRRCIPNITSSTAHLPVESSAYIALQSLSFADRDEARLDCIFQWAGRAAFLFADWTTRPWGDRRGERCKASLQHMSWRFLPRTAVLPRRGEKKRLVRCRRYEISPASLLCCCEWKSRTRPT